MEKFEISKKIDEIMACKSKNKVKTLQDLICNGYTTIHRLQRLGVSYPNSVIKYFRDIGLPLTEDKAKSNNGGIYKIFRLDLTRKRV